MFLFGVEIVLASYIGIRLGERRVKQQLLAEQSLQPNASSSHLHSTKQENSINKAQDDAKDSGALAPLDNAGEDNSRDTHLHYMKSSGASILLSGLAHLNPLFFIVMLPVFTYSALPYLRIVEHSLLVKKKVDGYVLYGIADLMTLGLGRTMTASFAVGLVHSAHFVISNAQQNSKQSLLDVFAQQPSTVWLYRDGMEVETPLAQVVPGDVVVVRTGELIPVDGVIIGGIAAIDQHTLTGESQPVEKAAGDTVFASTQVMTGRLQILVKTSGSETTVAKITEVLKHSIDFKTNSQMQGEKWADSWNLPVLGLAFAAMPWLGAVGTVVILNGHIAQNIRIVAPLSTLNYLNLASHQGLLVKDGRVLEDLPNIDTFLFDKTGTLTHDEPEVGRILVYLEEYSEHEILAYAAAAEYKLKHPIARAIVKRAEALELISPALSEADYQIGYGVTVHIHNKRIQVGSERFMLQQGVNLPESLEADLYDANNAGHTAIMLAIDGQLAGVLEMCATIRPEVRDLLHTLRSFGVKHTAIVSGDHRQPTAKLAVELGMDEYFYEVLPQDKAEIVERLQAQGRRVCFVGDGVNDTIAMKKANISISLSGATTVATDTAQIVLMDGSLKKLPDLVKLSHDLRRNLNDGWLYNIVPGTLTIFSAFLRVDIIVALLLSQGGLGLGILNAMHPLRQIAKDGKPASAHGTERLPVRAPADTTLEENTKDQKDANCCHEPISCVHPVIT